jgi:hypothetical protein
MGSGATHRPRPGRPVGSVRVIFECLVALRSFPGVPFHSRRAAPPVAARRPSAVCHAPLCSAWGGWAMLAGGTTPRDPPRAPARLRRSAPGCRSLGCRESPQGWAPRNPQIWHVSRGTGPETPDPGRAARRVPTETPGGWWRLTRRRSPETPDPPVARARGPGTPDLVGQPGASPTETPEGWRSSRRRSPETPDPPVARARAPGTPDLVRQPGASPTGTQTSHVGRARSRDGPGWREGMWAGGSTAVRVSRRWRTLGGRAGGSRGCRCRVRGACRGRR